MMRVLVYALCGFAAFAATTAALRALTGNRLPGGRADGRHASTFDASQLELGTRVELEHTRNRALAREIAMDHLVEDPRYYDKLIAAGL